MRKEKKKQKKTFVRLEWGWLGAAVCECVRSSGHLAGVTCLTLSADELENSKHTKFKIVKINHLMNETEGDWPPRGGSWVGDAF